MDFVAVCNGMMPFLKQYTCGFVPNPTGCPAGWTETYHQSDVIADGWCVCCPRTTDNLLTCSVSAR